MDHDRAAGIDRERVALGAAMGIFVLVLVRTAWVAEDAFINFRVIDNFLHGYGLRWNIAERVQIFTDPLWVLILSAASFVTHEYYYTALALSFACTIGALVVYARVAGDRLTAAAGIVLLMTSKAFVDYSTSGLEGPLVHFLLACLLFVYWKAEVPTPRTLGGAAALASLGAVTRLDTLLLSAPVLAAMAWRAGIRSAWRPVLLGSLPLVAWECFAVLYYGFPFPNTAYAKLGGNIPQTEKIVQGCLYLLDSVERDPVTLVAIVTSMAAPVLTRRRGEWPVSAGLLLTLLYTVWIGGDFMSGRFLTGGMLVATMALTREVRVPDARVLAPLPIALAVVMSGATHGAVFATDGRLRDEFIDRERPVDERRVNYPFTGLMSVSREGAGLTHPWAQQARDLLAQGRPVVEWGAAGIFSFTVGRSVHIIDFYGLGDAFLARLPAQRRWYPGHVKRTLPWGYLETIASGRNQITDPALAMYYEQIQLVTRDRIWSRRRLRAIWRLNTGSYDHLTTSPR